MLYCKHYFSLLNTFMRKDKAPQPDPDPYFWLMDPDPDTGGPTYRISNIAYKQYF